LKNGDFYGCIRECSTIIQEDSDNVKALYRRHLCYVKHGEFQKALIDLRRALRCTPLHPSLKRSAEELKRGMNQTHYEVLGVAESASFYEIRESYKRRALEWHPDRQRTTEGKENASDRMKAINEAYTVLNSSQSRQVYDSELVYEREASEPVRVCASCKNLAARQCKNFQCNTCCQGCAYPRHSKRGMRERKLNT